VLFGSGTHVAAEQNLNFITTHNIPEYTQQTLDKHSQKEPLCTESTHPCVIHEQPKTTNFSISSTVMM
jgi:hypothetical protein